MLCDMVKAGDVRLCSGASVHTLVLQWCGCASRSDTGSCRGCREDRHTLERQMRGNPYVVDTEGFGWRLQDIRAKLAGVEKYARKSLRNEIKRWLSNPAQASYAVGMRRNSASGAARLEELFGPVPRVEAIVIADHHIALDACLKGTKKLRRGSVVALRTMNRDAFGKFGQLKGAGKPRVTSRDLQHDPGRHRLVQKAFENWTQLWKPWRYGGQGDRRHVPVLRYAE